MAKSYNGDDKMKPMQILLDYNILIETTAIYNYISETDIQNWEEIAKEDEWLQTLEEMAEKYQIKYDKDSDGNELIYHLEDLLINHLKDILLE